MIAQKYPELLGFTKVPSPHSLTPRPRQQSKAKRTPN